MTRIRTRGGICVDLVEKLPETAIVVDESNEIFICLLSFLGAVLPPLSFESPPFGNEYPPTLKIPRSSSTANSLDQAIDRTAQAKLYNESDTGYVASLPYPIINGMVTKKRFQISTHHSSCLCADCDSDLAFDESI